MAGTHRYAAVLDACVLYSALVRNIVISLADADLYHAKWSADMEQEWLENLLANRKDLKRDRLQETCRAMAAAVPNSMVKNYQPLISTLSLPDAKDRHVLAAAIKCSADAIVTFNVSDFPADALEPFQIECQHPDEFIVNQLDLSAADGIAAIKAMRARMKNPAYSPIALIDAIERHQLPQTASYLREWQGLI